MLVNSSEMKWFDSDAYNAHVGKTIDGCASDGSNCGNGDELITQRFASLCSSFRNRDLRFFLIVTGNDEAEDEDGDAITSGSDFRRIAGPGLSECAVKSTDLTYYKGEDFTVSEQKITDRLNEIVQELRQESSFVRLIE
ncbi:hypothetical protein ACQFN5_28380 (plasmid) [Klebsiella sp. WOUb02]|uniref:hypothetical protein n=1 Tax=Klebsiella sp. WOUb02 TaxID=3161071 RepID=UPI003CE8754D